jgi:hypothetical protein
MGIPSPVLLANKDNAAILKEYLEPGSEKYDDLTELQKKAFENSTCGAVKACAIAGISKTTRLSLASYVFGPNL